jgi:GNAT superfamily N-acetyltransferase
MTDEEKRKIRSAVLDLTKTPPSFTIGHLEGRAAVRREQFSIGIMLIADTPGGTIAIGVVSADEFFGEGRWWISRCLVQKPYRGRGIGSFLLDELKKLAVDRKGFVRLEVEPGGYAMDLERQRAFYVRSGFLDAGDGLFTWTREA